MNRLLIAALALSLALVSPAGAVTGTPPIIGPALQDGTWLNGLAGGQNFSYIYGITAAGVSSQAASTALTPGYFLYEVDTSLAAGSSGVTLPPCLQGVAFVLNNNTAYTVLVYPNVANNPVTAAQDVIDVGSQATSTSITTYASKIFACAKNGVWTVK
jgi:hypothetical protein